MSNWIESEYALGRKQWFLSTVLFVLRVQDNGKDGYNWMVCPKEYADHYSESNSVAAGCSYKPIKARLDAIEALIVLMETTVDTLYNATPELT